jgi:hypothetical protein
MFKKATFILLAMFSFQTFTMSVKAMAAAEQRGVVDRIHEPLLIGYVATAVVDLKNTGENDKQMTALKLALERYKAIFSGIRDLPNYKKHKEAINSTIQTDVARAIENNQRELVPLLNASERILPVLPEDEEVEADTSGPKELVKDVRQLLEEIKNLSDQYKN